LNIVLRDKGLEGEEALVLSEDEVLEFIRCCCATDVDGSISSFNGLLLIPRIQWLLQAQIVFSLVMLIRMNILFIGFLLWAVVGLELQSQPQQEFSTPNTCANIRCE
jgi:hypothetical protein